MTLQLWLSFCWDLMGVTWTSPSVPISASHSEALAYLPDIPALIRKIRKQHDTPKLGKGSSTKSPLFRKAVDSPQISNELNHLQADRREFASSALIVSYRQKQLDSGAVQVFPFADPGIGDSIFFKEKGFLGYTTRGLFPTNSPILFPPVFLSSTAYPSYMNKFHWRMNKNSRKK
ncbi:hypothetical protein HJG60_009598 [Phyllostomus discolor]|uniref:Uncharacterized protein n=1 Tax=Phyllostomus discolor TaxID=89673 RepID=A0A834DAW4_9CHIR|nr:hypothetical protein HJG60_009598 [Phyllostomus discolor]